MESIRKQKNRLYLSDDQYAKQNLRGKGWSYDDINRYPSIVGLTQQILNNHRLCQNKAKTSKT
jgi:hypothetical protein